MMEGKGTAGDLVQLPLRGGERTVAQMRRARRLERIYGWFKEGPTSLDWSKERSSTTSVVGIERPQEETQRKRKWRSLI